MTFTQGAVWVLLFALVYFPAVAYLTLKEYRPMSDRISRALRTGIQTFLGVIVPTVIAKAAEVKGISDLSAIASAIGAAAIAALSMALSAAWYTLFPPVKPAGE